MTSIVRCPTYSTSSAELKRWRLKRIEECASSAEAPAVDHRRDPHARHLAPHVERADALGAVDEMRGARQQVDAHRLDVDGDLADGLRGVGVEDDPLLIGDLSDGGNVLDGPDLVVGEHHRDEDR